MHTYTQFTRRHQTCHCLKHATSAAAEGPVHGLDFARRCEFPLRPLLSTVEVFVTRTSMLNESDVP